jgi:hypothetical protein
MYVKASKNNNSDFYAYQNNSTFTKKAFQEVGSLTQPQGLNIKIVVKKNRFQTYGGGVVP